MKILGSKVVPDLEATTKIVFLGSIDSARVLIDPAFDQFFDGLLILFRTRKNRQEVRVIVDVDALDLL